ncbi:hypothetical protein PROFUN_05985 [Planoprotostelium fungivorum]|uniref:Uncharacterized protein n=1 Tax=Planoprotostelium fungivorum TaxID=1890364 RepID=A0A2P6NPA9_9EUKA|nr:hypothetical protein PROFUN_05985 [Planoprotostelium fungivorum]
MLKSPTLLSPSLSSTEEDNKAELKRHKIANKNAQWLSSPGMWGVYLFLLVASRCILQLFLNTNSGWTTWNVLHAIVTFFALHWVKGAPFSTEGTHIGDTKYHKLTLWEQIDGGVQYTPARKFLTFVAILVFVVTLHFTAYNPLTFFINTTAFAVIFIAKQPFMAKVRLFGINSD